MGHGLLILPFPPPFHPAPQHRDTHRGAPRAEIETLLLPTLHLTYSLLLLGLAERFLQRNLHVYHHGRRDDHDDPNDGPSEGHNSDQGDVRYRLGDFSAVEVHGNQNHHQRETNERFDSIHKTPKNVKLTTGMMANGTISQIKIYHSVPYL